MENSVLKARAESLATEARRFADALQLCTKPKEDEDRLYKVTRSQITCKVNITEMVYVFAKNDWEAERKAELNGWRVNTVEVQRHKVIF